MHSEHLTNVRPGLVALGWFIGAALVSGIAIALIAVGILTADTAGGTVWGVAAIAVAFFAAGWYVGFRAGAAPILYAVAMGLFSLLVWFVVNLIPGQLLHAESWSAGPAYTAGLLIVQIVAAAIGGLIASREARAGSAPSS
jgi:uncharacterized membrane protein